MILLGCPGPCKSTFLNMLCAELRVNGNHTFIERFGERHYYLDSPGFEDAPIPLMRPCMHRDVTSSWGQNPPQTTDLTLIWCDHDLCKFMREHGDLTGVACPPELPGLGEGRRQARRKQRLLSLDREHAFKGPRTNPKQKKPLLRLKKGTQRQ